MSALLEATDGRLTHASIPGETEGFEPTTVEIDAITEGGEIVGVFIAADCMVDLRNLRNLVHALQCAIEPYGVAEHQDGGA